MPYRRCRANDSADGMRLQSSPLEVAEYRTADAGGPRNIFLSQPAPVAHGTQPAADGLVSHTSVLMRRSSNGAAWAAGPGREPWAGGAGHASPRRRAILHAAAYQPLTGRLSHRALLGEQLVEPIPRLDRAGGHAGLERRLDGLG